MIDIFGMVFVAVLITAIVYIAFTFPSIYGDDEDKGE